MIVLAYVLWAHDLPFLYQHFRSKIDPNLEGQLVFSAKLQYGAISGKVYINVCLRQVGNQ